MPGRILMTVDVGPYSIVEYESGKAFVVLGGRQLRDITDDQVTLTLARRLAELEKQHAARTR